MKNMNLKKMVLYWFPVILWVLLIFHFSSFPTNPVTKIRITDFLIKKSAHIIEYGILTLLLYRAFLASGFKERQSGIFAIIAAVIYGISDEIHQSFTPGREPRVRDVLFDSIGAIGMIYFIKKVLPSAPKEVQKIAKVLQIL